MGLAEVIHRMVTDEAFAVQLQEETDQALATAGFSLSPDEREALLAIFSLGNQMWQNLWAASFAEPVQFPWATSSFFQEVSCFQPLTAP